MKAMSDVDGLASLASDLLALTARDRRAILASLTKFERTRIEAILEREAARAKDGPNSVSPEFAGFSPWLAARLRQANDRTGDVRFGACLTDTTREAMLDLADRFEARDLHEKALGPAPGERKSLFGAIGGLFARLDARA
jgi:hypothetical protein